MSEMKWFWASNEPETASGVINSGPVEVAWVGPYETQADAVGAARKKLDGSRVGVWIESRTSPVYVAFEKPEEGGFVG